MDLEILLQLKDEASAAFQAAGKSITKTSDTIKKGLNTNVNSFIKWGTAAGVAATGLAVAFGIDAIKGYGQAQASLARVDATLKAMGVSAVKNRDAVLAAANAAVKLGFDDEDAAESITRFYQATNDLTQATKLNNLAMDLARAKNIDLSTAAGLVNQVLSGNGRILKQYQIALDETKTPLEQLGQLQVQVAGQAEGFARTWPGLIATVTQTWSNMKDTIGGVLVEALEPFVKQFTTWLLDPKTQENFKKWTENFKSWADVIIPTVIETFRIWAIVLDGIFKTLTKIGDIILRIVAGSDEVSNINTRGVQIGLGAGNLPHRAMGGPVSRNSPYIVGENGPEIFMPGSNGSIIPNRTGGEGSGTGGVTVNMNGNFYGSDPDMARRMGDDIAKIIAQQLKLRTI